MKRVFIPTSDLIHMSEDQYWSVLKMSGIDSNERIIIKNAPDGNYYMQEEPKLKLMDLKEFMHLQAGLDNIIMDKVDHPLTVNELLNSKIVAMFTEMGEMANEISCHKYWKHNHKMDDSKVLSEYVDIYFFWLGLGNLMGYTPEQIQAAYMEKYNENIHRQKNNY